MVDRQVYERREKDNQRLASDVRCPLCSQCVTGDLLQEPVGHVISMIVW